MCVCVHIGTYVYEIAYTCIDIFRMILGKKLVAVVASGKENWVAGVGVEEDFSLYSFYPKDSEMFRTTTEIQIGSNSAGPDLCFLACGMRDSH